MTNSSTDCWVFIICLCRKEILCVISWFGDEVVIWVKGFTQENSSFWLDSVKEILENWCNREQGGICSAEEQKREPQQVIYVGPRWWAYILCIFSEWDCLPQSSNPINWWKQWSFSCTFASSVQEAWALWQPLHLTVFAASLRSLWYLPGYRLFFTHWILSKLAPCAVFPNNGHKNRM